MVDVPRILFDHGFIDEQLRKELEAAAARGRIKEHREVLAFLRDAMMRRFSPHGAMVFVSVPQPATVAERAEASAQLASQIDLLATTRIVSAAVAAGLRKQVDAGQIVAPFQLVMAAAALSDFAEFMSSARVRGFADRLLDNGVLDVEAHARMLEDSNEGKLTSNFDLVRYCRHAAAFELARYPSDLASFLPQIHADVAALLPELAFTDFGYRIDEGAVVGADLRVSLKVKGTRYAQTSFIDPEAVTNGRDLGRIDQQQFYQIFNKVLSDGRSQLRMHLVKSWTHYGTTRAADYSRFGIIALTEKQSEAFRQLEPVGNDYVPFMDISYERFERRPSAEEVRTAIAVYRSAGILSSLSEAAVAQHTEAALASPYSTFNDIIGFFPGVTCRISLKSDSEKPYAAILSELSEISRSRFRPERVVDDGGSPVRVSFALGGKTFSSTFKTEGRWFDPAIFDFIVQAQTEADEEGRFHTLKDDNEAVLIYLTDEQLQIVQREGVLEIAT
jgi:hypothetical protein